MTEIVAKNLSLNYPVLGIGHTAMTGMPTTMTSGKTRYIAALKDISFNIQAGQKVGILGQNGSGKSTLLRVLGGIYHPSAGRLKVRGNVSSLFNLNLGIRPEYSGRDNIVLRGIIKGYKHREINALMDEIIDFSELWEFIDMPMRTYSAGMSMRLVFAIATAFTPEILLLDEWIGAGDKKFQEKATTRMNELVDKAGITVLASHNRPLIRSVCDTAIWLDRGVLRGMGPVDEIYELMDSHV